jgi:hypothetical protein
MNTLRITFLAAVATLSCSSENPNPPQPGCGLELTTTGALEIDVNALDGDGCSGGSLSFMWNVDNQPVSRLVLRVYGFTRPAPRTNLPGDLRFINDDTNQEWLLNDCNVDIDEAAPSSPGSDYGTFRGSATCTPELGITIEHFSFMSIGGFPD